jgi:exopolyphosphatase / guanosine-5'-triphosphate,3'-diphosphate pyrophosphatase
MESAPEFVAAVDLGSNSFHMVVARNSNGRLRIVDRMKEMVQLAAGLDENDCIDDTAKRRALDCLERFGQRLRGFEHRAVRIVGTNTLRRAHNSVEFLAEAREALGQPIEIIAGREEARLIYQGVAHNITDVTEQRLVMDIGGGSTEFIIGRRYTPLQMESLYMGCVAMSRECFDDGEITLERMERAELLASQELEAIQTPYLRIGWGHSIGASGTILAVRDVVRGRGWSDDGITAESLERLRATLIEAGHVDRLDLPELPKRRASVFAGGVAILCATFRALNIKRMQCSDSALREGILYDLQGRLGHTDMREEALAELSRHYQVDSEQANRIERTALHLRAQVNREWRLRRDFFGNLLSWSARLHEVGVGIAHNQYHKHGAYILQYSDLPGFSRQEQALMGKLVRIHRRKFATSELDELEPKLGKRIERLAVLLRLAVVLHRSRTDAEVPQLRVDEGQIELEFPPRWLEEHPLTRADVEQEAEYLRVAGYRMRINDTAG